jgi:Ca-activated chloride channel family protein
VHFLRPDLLQWWLALPVVVVAWAVNYGYRQLVRRKARVATRFAGLSRRSTLIRGAAVLFTCLIAVGALIFALMRPQVFATQKTAELEQQDLVLLLDRSQSMRAHDIRPSRFTRATTEIENFLKKKPNTIGRVGLVSFAGAPIVLSYLTADIGIIGFYLDWADKDVKPQYGTNIGGALNLALEVAKKDNRPTKKIFVLISDGEDKGQELMDAVNKFRARGYAIHCIGIGSEDQVVVPVLDKTGKEVPLKDETGAVIKTRFEESTLKSIAQVTGGRYFRSTTGDDLIPAINGIVGQSRRIVGWKTSIEARELYPLGLAIAGAAGGMLLLLL